MSAQILVVEDEPISQSILVNLLLKAGHTVVATDSASHAWKCLCDAQGDFDAILLDRTLPDMNGLDLLARIRADKKLGHIPVILNTAMVEPEEVLAGLRAGAYYYVTKPIQQDSLMAIVDSAIRHVRDHRSLLEEIHRTNDVLIQMTSAEFQFRTPEQARGIASLLCHAIPEGSKVVMGLSELLLNAVEHGNLGISYEEKSQLMQDGRIWQEIQARLNHPDYADKWAVVRFERGDHEVRFTIRDQGKGFDWQYFLNMSPERAFHSHGRGIAMARMMSFCELRYQDPGNEVLAICRFE